jgi:hypothetical protein
MFGCNSTTFRWLRWRGPAATVNYRPSRQRGRYNITNSNCLTQNLEEIANLVAGPRWAPDAKTDWPTHMSVVMWLWLWGGWLLVLWTEWVERIEKCCVKFIKQRIIVQLQPSGIVIIIIIIIVIIIGVNPLHLAYSSTLKMEEICFTETSVEVQRTSRRSFGKIELCTGYVSNQADYVNKGRKILLYLS